MLMYVVLSIRITAAQNIIYCAVNHYVILFNTLNNSHLFLKQLLKYHGTHKELMPLKQINRVCRQVLVKMQRKLKLIVR